MNLTAPTGWSTLKDKDLLLKLDTWLRESEMSIPEMHWRESAEIAYDFYANRQDSKKVKQYLIDHKRPTSVYNEIKPKIDKLVGLADQVRRVPEVVPVGVEDEALAELMNGAFRHFRKKSGTADREIEAFEHGVKSGRSFLYFYIDNSNPFYPRIKTKRIPGRDVHVDPNSVEYKMDEDARFVSISRWFNREDISAYWPKFKDEISRMAQWDMTQYVPRYFDEFKHLYRLVEMYYKVPEKVVWVLNPMTGEPEVLSVAEWKELEKSVKEGTFELPNGKKLTKLPDAIPSVKKNVYYAIFSGSVMLEHGKSKYAYDGYPIVLYGAYKDENENKWFSAIDTMIDPQKALNTMRRQLSHLLQTSPKGILKYEVGSILNIDEYDQHSSEPNFKLEIAKGMYDRVGFTNQPQISPIYGELDAMFRQAMKDDSGIQDVLMGKETSSRAAGITEQLRLESNIAVLFLLFKNFRESRVNGAKILLSMIQQYIKMPQMIRIEGPNGMQLAAINSQTNRQVEGFNDLSAGRFDLEIDEAAENATSRREIANVLSTYAQNNPGSIPPEVILEYMDVPLSVRTKVAQYNQARIENEQAIEMAKIKGKEKGDQNGGK